MSYQHENQYVYIHKTLNGIPFYVGKGKLSRITWAHRGDEWAEIAKNGFVIEVAASEVSDEMALLCESALIHKYGLRSKGGLLINKRLATTWRRWEDIVRTYEVWINKLKGSEFGKKMEWWNVSHHFCLEMYTSIYNIDLIKDYRWRNWALKA